LAAAPSSGVNPQGAAPSAASGLDAAAAAATRHPAAGGLRHEFTGGRGTDGPVIGYPNEGLALRTGSLWGEWGCMYVRAVVARADVARSEVSK
jgi:hypothetical protein